RQGLIEVSEALTHSGQGSLYLIGINKFRDINDSIGHHNGDQLLIHIAERLKQQLHDEATLARIGGDEFAVFMPTTHSDEDISLMERRLQQLLAAPFMLDGETVVVKISVGVVRTQP
ncbi:GGDEF domain-containing protein, partial [Vibrio harveyi]